MTFERYGEATRHPFRSRRFFVDNGHWYFSEREGALHGPYSDRPSAERGLAEFLAQKVYVLPDDQRHAVEGVVGVQDNVQSLVHEVLVFISNKQVSEAHATAMARKRIVALGSDQFIDQRQARIDILNHLIDHDKGYVVRPNAFTRIAN